MLERPRKSSRACDPKRLSRCVVFGLIASVSVVANANAQEAEPRSYTNTPVGLNFLIAGYGYSQGILAFDPTLSIADAPFHAHTEAVAVTARVDADEVEREQGGRRWRRWLGEAAHRGGDEWPLPLSIQVYIS